MFEVLGVRSFTGSFWKMLMPMMMFSFAEDGAGGGGGEGDGEEGQGGEGGASDDWRVKAGVAEEYRNHPALTSYKDINGLVKSHVEQQKLIGKDKVPIPAGPDDKATLALALKRLGHPDTVDGYKRPEGVQYPEGMEVPTDEQDKALFAKAHELGLLPHQVEGLYKWHAEQRIAAHGQTLAAQEKAYNDGMTDLRKEWGRATEQNLSLANKTLKHFAGGDVEAIQDGFGSDPKVIRMLAKIGQSIAEDTLAGGNRGFQYGTMTPDQAKAEIASIKGDSDHPYWTDSHPEHKLAKQRMKDLYEMAYPEQK